MIILKKMIMDLYMLTKYLFFCYLSIIEMDFILNETPSMNNIYESDYYSTIKKEEQKKANIAYDKSKYPFQTGVVPSPSSADMFMSVDEYDKNNNRYINSLSGNKIPIEDFNHGNMQHFLRKGITQSTNFDNNSAFSEKFGYNDYKVKKTEVETFFQPTTDTSLIRGMSDNSDFLRERTNLGNLQNNYNPITSIRVAPGLNKGYNSEGTGGFHQADTLIYAKPKQRDELRSGNDQRSSIFEIPIQGPSKNPIDKRGMITPINKNKPETVYRQSEENWFKGQSILKKDTNRPEENLKDTTRIATHKDYYGPIKNQQEQMNSNDDHGRKSIIVYNTEKHELAKKETPVANLSSVFKAFVAPITDAIKITLKEYLIDSARYYGNATPQIPEKLTTYDPTTHSMKTTIKETTIHDNNGGILTGDKETYSSLYDNAKTTTKETTIHDNNGGILTGDKETYSGLYDNAKTTTKETMLFESQKNNLTGDKETYSSLYDDAKTTVKETTIHDNNGGILTGDKETYSGLYDNAKTTMKETMIHDDYTGNIKVRELSYVKNNDKTKTTLRQTLPIQDTTRNINNVNYKSTYVYDPSIIAKTTLKETTVNSSSSQFGFISGFINNIIGSYINKEENAKNTQRQYSHVEYNGGLKSSVTFIPTDREAEMNAEIDGTRELILMKAGHTPNGAGNFKGLDKKDISMGVKRQIDLYETNEPTRNINKIYQTGPIQLEDKNLTTYVRKENAFENRLDSTILSSIANNKDVIKINPIRTNDNFKNNDIDTEIDVSKMKNNYIYDIENNKC
jgi:hypothetical protein